MELLKIRVMRALDIKRQDGPGEWERKNESGGYGEGGVSEKVEGLGAKLPGGSRT